MNLSQIAVILFGLFAGYWIVAKFFFRDDKKGRPSASGTPGPDSAPAQPARAATPSWTDVLQVPAGASLEEIRAAYRSLIAKYHPDKVDSLGADLKAMANEKSKEINAAYERALQARGAGS